VDGERLDQLTILNLVLN